MKIPLDFAKDGMLTAKDLQARALERDVQAAKDGDWNARHSLVRTFLPLITSLAEKRSADPVEINKYIDAGKDGVLTAAKKYKPGAGTDKFHIFALDFIEKSMDQSDKGGGFFAKLFGR